MVLHDIMHQCVQKTQQHIRQNTPLEKKARRRTGFQSIKSGCGEQFLLLDCRATARAEGGWFSQTNDSRKWGPDAIAKATVGVALDQIGALHPAAVLFQVVGGVPSRVWHGGGQFRHAQPGVMCWSKQVF